jgi:hypothetical protein
LGSHQRMSDIQAQMKRTADGIIERIKADAAERARCQSAESLMFSGRLAAFVIGGQWRGTSANCRALAHSQVALGMYRGLAEGREPSAQPELTNERLRAYVAARRAIRGLTLMADLASASARLFDAATGVYECARPKWLGQSSVNT